LFLFCSHNPRRESSPNFVDAQSRFQTVEPAGKKRTLAPYKGDMTALRPDLMTPTERLDELAEILALGLMRLKANKSSGLSARAGESSLDYAARQSGHANPLKRPGGLD
jgi:hypothetical protein